MAMRILTFLMLLVASTVAGACDLAFTGGWVPEAPPGTAMWAGYGTLRNAGNYPVTVTALSSPQFASIMAHETVIVGDVAHMRGLEPLIVPAHGDIRFEQGGKHLMLMQPNVSLAVGSDVQIQMTASGCDKPIIAMFSIQSRDRG